MSINQDNGSSVCSKSYWCRFFIYIAISILVPFATLFSNLTTEVVNGMSWFSWVGNILSCLVSALVTIRAYLDTSSGRIASDKEWETYLKDVKDEVDNRLNNRGM